MELADGGDLFDKVEADEGCGEDLAHFYFTQLVAAVGWCHSRGVAHRDIKPENVLVSGDGDLKLADFGLATQYMDRSSGKRKQCSMVCGSPPYIAPEILATGNANGKRKGDAGGEVVKVGYDPQSADVWSVAIVLFVLLAGNTPWDSPVLGESYEFHSYITSNKSPEDELWAKVPKAATGLVKGMLEVNTQARLTLEDVRRDAWFNRHNKHINGNPVDLATELVGKMHINLDPAHISAFQQQQQSHQQQQLPTPRDTPDAMELDPPLSQNPNDWEPPSRSQPYFSQHLFSQGLQQTQEPQDFLASLSQDPTMSQFQPTPSIPLTLTQQARRFRDIVPVHSMAVFYSYLPLQILLSQLMRVLQWQGMQVWPPTDAGGGGQTMVRVKGFDARKLEMQGQVVVEGVAEGVLEVRFLKAKGDPLGWRRLFKSVVVGCYEGLVRPPPGL